jgi:ribosomal protein S27E|tara:strand:+ start:112 stop:801 length:690 start_codon:yes stop_codon:yes gene_type:complete
MGILFKDEEERSLRLKAFAFMAIGIIVILFEELTDGFISEYFAAYDERARGCRTGQELYTECEHVEPIMSLKIATLLISGFVLWCTGFYYGIKADKYRKEFIEIEKELEALRGTKESNLQSKMFSDTILLVLGVSMVTSGVFFLPLGLAGAALLFYYLWKEGPVMIDRAQYQSKILEKEKKRPSLQFTPKSILVDIECPGCNAQMKVPELNKIQEVTCRECGLSGEIEI